jgi:hypothetical protein
LEERFGARMSRRYRSAPPNAVASNIAANIDANDLLNATNPGANVNPLPANALLFSECRGTGVPNLPNLADSRCSVPHRFALAQQVVALLHKALERHIAVLMQALARRIAVLLHKALVRRIAVVLHKALVRRIAVLLHKAMARRIAVLLHKALVEHTAAPLRKAMSRQSEAHSHIEVGRFAVLGYIEAFHIAVPRRTEVLIPVVVPFRTAASAGG